ncbi:MAG: ParB/RepB/Spo0J family partition protein [Lachnospiraceae bacterium]|jgi:ParB family chromosome partitioning protein|nr:ParB/RepB/Spo0J family partition protein [Lachnospiraceae bacterium]MBP5565792.1 ParB/RepB/Spo0J family partition protein [Lachnospiraceae bacterium]MBQ4275873.1 ParB/RepB/Spo0J family partition protein [Lachnospiraceae bacterium]MCR4696660.1 ParB/RepB/Spo0J family partition protein [Lachnospiraceae bacterium]
MALKKGLNKGRGLSVLIDTETDKPSVSEEVKNSITMLNISKVEPNKSQPRKNFNEDALQELADSIKEHGIIEPLIVQDRGKYYEIIAGERRWRAANLAGLTEVPVIIKNLTNLEIMEIALIENIQREDLNPIEEALAYKHLMDESNYTQDALAQRVGKNRTTITNAMRLLKLCPDVQQMLIDEMLSAGHARALLSVENPELQYTLAQRVFDEKMSVRDIEKEVKNLDKKPKPDKKPVQVSEQFKKYEGVLKDKLSTKVSVTAKENGSGKIEIEFYSNDDFDRIMGCFK